MTPRSASSFMKRSENHQMRLVTRPVGIPQPEHFALVTEPLPQIGDEEMLVRNHYLSVDPAQRGWANDEGNYSAPVPLDTRCARSPSVRSSKAMRLNFVPANLSTAGSAGRPIVSLRRMRCCAAFIIRPCRSAPI